MTTWKVRRNAVADERVSNVPEVSQYFRKRYQMLRQG